MTEMSRGFNFDDFDEQINEALLQNEDVMGKLGGAIVDYELEA